MNILTKRPRSRTVHAVSNVEVVEASAGKARVCCALVVHELRTGDWRQQGLGLQRTLPGRCEYLLCLIEGEWRIRLKKVLLIGRDLPQENFTILF